MTIIFLLLTAAASSATAQGFSPSAPTQELIYFGGRLIAIEERGPAAAKTSVAPAASASSVSTTPVPPEPPKPTIPPQDTSANAGKLVDTPAETHVAVHP